MPGVELSYALTNAGHEASVLLPLWPPEEGEEGGEQALAIESPLARQVTVTMTFRWLGLAQAALLGQGGGSSSSSNKPGGAAGRQAGGRARGT